MRKLALVSLLAMAAGLAPAVSSASSCVPGDPNAAPSVTELEGFPEGRSGRYALPNEAPTMLVVYAHGYRNTSASWTCHLLDAASKGAAAVAMDNRGTGYAGGPDHPAAPGDNRGWFVREGAQDAIAAAQYFVEAYPTIDMVGLLGVSMGGNTSGLAAAAQALRESGRPLFDYWVSVEGAVNVAETYAAASVAERAGGQLGSYAGGAREDIEQQLGLNPREHPVAFARALANLSVVPLAHEIATSGLRGVAFVHALDDGLVPYNQSRELLALLRGYAMRASMYTVLRRNDWQNPGSASTEGGTVATGHALGPVMSAAGQQYPAPLAGHGWEGSSSHLVIKTGFDVLFDLMRGTRAPANDEFLVDGDLGVVPVA